LVLEAADAVGGRVRTDEVAGFRLDRGFQVLLTAYPAARRWLDFRALRLGEFRAGARVATPDGQGRVGDPWREPGSILETLRAPIGAVGDKLRIGALRLAAISGRMEEVWQRGDGRSAAQELAERGFSPEMVERFLRPWLGGIFLERELTTPAEMLYFVYRMFAEGLAALPAGGMQRIPEQLAGGLRTGSLRLGARVAALEQGCVRLADGEKVQAPRIVIATDADAAAAWLPEAVRAPAWRSVACLYWAAPSSPLRGEPVLWLNGTGRGRINHLVVPSDVAEGYAPEGQSLVSATVLGEKTAEEDGRLAADVQGELAAHFGGDVPTWELLGVRRVRRALPALSKPGPGADAASVRPGIWVCGDHTASASIQGAMASGEAVAARIVGEIGV
jgi:phytoene dehydrogenase-like protein